jgi:hypothetical protein
MGSDLSIARRLARVARRREGDKSLADASKGGRTRATVAVILSAVSIVISSLSLTVTIYYQYYREYLGLVVLSEIQESNPDVLTVSFAFSNPGNRTVLVEDIHLFEIEGSLSSRPNCVDTNVLKQYKYQSLNPTYIPETHVLSATSIQVGKTATHMFAIDSSKVETAVATFQIPKGELISAGTVIAHCPMYRYAEPSGRVWDSICEGWLMTAILENLRPTPRVIDVPHGPAFLLSAAEKTSHCATTSGE